MGHGAVTAPTNREKLFSVDGDCFMMVFIPFTLVDLCFKTLFFKIISLFRLEKVLFY